MEGCTKPNVVKQRRKEESSVTLQLSASPGLGRCGWKGGERTGVLWRAKGKLGIAAVQMSGWASGTRPKNDVLFFHVRVLQLG